MMEDHPVALDLLFTPRPKFGLRIVVEARLQALGFRRSQTPTHSRPLPPLFHAPRYVHCVPNKKKS